MRMDRETIDAAIEEYGKLNLDPMYNDPGWANASPFGSTIVYGYLQLSLAAMIWKDIGITSDKAYSLNYGLNRVRFPAPLRVGVPVQGTVRMLSVERKSKYQILWRVEFTITQEGSQRPSMVAEALFATIFYNP